MTRIRVCHVLGSLNRGGIETWLLNVFRHIDRKQYEFHFCCLSGEPGYYAAEVENLEGVVHPYRLEGRILAFDRDFRRLLESGKFDVVHSHVHLFSGFILRSAAKAGVLCRIAHSFTAPPGGARSVTRRGYEWLMRRWIGRYATVGLGNSQHSMGALFGPGWQTDDRWRLAYCGIDLAAVGTSQNDAGVRSRHGIPETARIVGHVGRMDRAKNHRFLIDVAAEVMRARDDAWLVLVGDGPLREEIQVHARARGLERLVFAGAVPEVYPYLRSMDLIVFPSLWEGLPQALIEAQAAGLRCLCADNVTREVAIVPGAVEFLSLSVGPQVWADRALRLLDAPRLDGEYARAIVADSPFAIENSVAELCRFYNGMT